MLQLVFLLLHARGSTSYTVHSSDCVRVEHADFGKERVADGMLDVGRGTHAPLPASPADRGCQRREEGLTCQRPGGGEHSGTRFYLTDPQVQTDIMT